MNWLPAGVVVTLVLLQLSTLPGAISGSVIKAGTALRQPLPNSRLELKGGALTVIARTDANGRFVISNLAPGEYRLTVTSDGFIRQEYSKKIVINREQPTANIGFELEPAPTAAGWILNVYGEPIANLLVEALRRSYDVRGNPGFARAATALTDDRGQYRIFWLDPGEYFFYVSSPLPDDGNAATANIVLPTYFPGVSTAEDAQPVRMNIGREERVDFKLQRAGLWAIKGQTANGFTGRSMAATITLAPPAKDPSLSRYRAQSAPTGPSAGEFSLLGIPPGSYILTAKSGSGAQEFTVVERIELRPVLNPSQPYSIQMMLSPPLSISGRMFVESREATDLRQASVSLVSVDSDLPSPKSVLARPDGQFVLNGVVRGSYVLDIKNLPGDLYLKAARFGDGDALAKPITWESRDQTKPLQILLGSDGGHLPVAAYDGKGELHHDAHFVLAPDGVRRSQREQYRIATSGEDGLAFLRGIPPGSYKLFAWEELEPNAYLNSDYMRLFEGFGLPVNIAAGNNPRLSARLIPR